MREIPKGFYLDADGNLQVERRKTPDRRTANRGMRKHDLRKFYRRKADRELYEKDHRAIDEALEDFAKEHDGKI